MKVFMQSKFIMNNYTQAQLASRYNYQIGITKKIKDSLDIKNSLGLLLDITSGSKDLATHDKEIIHHMIKSRMEAMKNESGFKT